MDIDKLILNEFMLEVSVLTSSHENPLLDQAIKIMTTGREGKRKVTFNKLLRMPDVLRNSVMMYGDTNGIEDDFMRVKKGGQYVIRNMTPRERREKTDFNSRGYASGSYWAREMWGTTRDAISNGHPDCVVRNNPFRATLRFYTYLSAADAVLIELRERFVRSSKRLFVYEDFVHPHDTDSFLKYKHILPKGYK